MFVLLSIRTLVYVLSGRWWRPWRLEHFLSAPLSASLTLCRMKPIYVIMIPVMGLEVLSILLVTNKLVLQEQTMRSECE